MKEAKGVKNDVDLTAEDLKELVGIFKKIYEDNEGKPFPQPPEKRSCFIRLGFLQISDKLSEPPIAAPLGPNLFIASLIVCQE